jgi:hypothetical protein
MPKVFSFCLYGTDDNYYLGLLENIQIIKEYYPDYEIFVYRGKCEKEWPLSNVNVIYTNREGPINTVFRYLPLQFAEIGFVRDSDSRITERDRWCIDEFLKSDKQYHIIRDHYWHKSPIMAGMFGWKEPLDIQLDTSDDSDYGIDETLLKDHVYPIIKEKTLVHTNIYSFSGEDDRRIEIPQKDRFDFVGNVIWNGVPKFEYFVDIHERLSFLQGQDKFKLMKYLTDGFSLANVPFHRRRQIIDAAYIANFYLDQVDDAVLWLRKYEFAEMDDHTITNAEFLIPKINLKKVACFDANRKGKDDEIVFYYGNYPYWYLSLPCYSEIYRHVSMFNRIQHDVVEYHPCWEKVGIIYILNLEERVDRYYETLNTLADVQAPLHRVHHYKAKVDGQPPYVGATQNHVDVMNHFKESPYEHCLILEDDFTFISHTSHVWACIQEYFEKDYDADICFLSISKDGETAPHDNLLSRSRQPCTTSSGYFLNKKTLDRVLSVASEGLDLIKTTDDHTGCIDRYWTRLPTIYYFRTKLGFQRPAYSNLQKTVIAHLD